MKLKTLPLLGGLFMLMGLSGLAHAAINTSQSPIADVYPSTGPVCLSVSTMTWTQFPPASAGNWDKRDGIYFLVRSTNSANMVGILTNTDTAPTGAVTSYDMLFVKGSPQATIWADKRKYLWLISLNATPEIGCGREFNVR